MAGVSGASSKSDNNVSASQNNASVSKTNETTKSQTAGNNTTTPKTTEQTNVPTNQNVAETYASRTGINVTKFEVQNAQTVQPTQTTATPLPQGLTDIQYDGALVGANGRAYPPDTPLSEIPMVEPRNGRTSDQPIVYTNGINTTFEAHQQSLQEIADRTGQPVVGVYNATEGTFRDLVQSAADKYDIGNNPAVSTLANTVYNELRAGRDVHLMAHSQGALITSRALTDVQNRMRLEDGMTREQTQNAMRNMNVETFGGAASSFPDGPRYVHYVNSRDITPNATGLGRSLDIPWRTRIAAYANPATRGLMATIDVIRFLAKPSYRPGENAQIRTFDYNSPTGGLGRYFVENHSFDDVYLPRRVPFDQAYGGQ